MKDVVLYRFDDGWEVRRVLELAERVRMTGRDLWEPTRGLFGLYDAAGTPKSSVDLELRYGGEQVDLVTGWTIYTPDGMETPQSMEVEKYWISFISETISEDKISDLVRSIIAYPDELLERLKTPDVDDQIKALADPPGTTKNILKPSEATVQAQALARATAEQAFDGLEGFKVLPPRHPLQSHYATIHVLSNDHVLLISAEDGGWTLRHGNNAMPSIKMYDQPSLTHVWEWYLDVVCDREHVDLLPDSQAEVWWEENTMPGHCLFDLEPYELLGVPSPFIWSDEKFAAWHQAQESS